MWETLKPYEQRPAIMVRKMPDIFYILFCALSTCTKLHNLYSIEQNVGHMRVFECVYV